MSQASIPLKTQLIKMLQGGAYQKMKIRASQHLASDMPSRAGKEKGIWEGSSLCCSFRNSQECFPVNLTKVLCILENT